MLRVRVSRWRPNVRTSRWTSRIPVPWTRGTGTGHGARATGHWARRHGARGTGHGARGTGHGARATGHGPRSTGHGLAGIHVARSTPCQDPYCSEQSLLGYQHCSQHGVLWFPSTGHGARGTGHRARATEHGTLATGHGARNTGHGAHGTGQEARATGHGAGQACRQAATLKVIRTRRQAGDSTSPQACKYSGLSMGRTGYGVRGTAAQRHGARGIWEYTKRIQSLRKVMIDLPRWCC